MKKKLISSVLALLMSIKSYSSGFPVIDISVLMQSVTQYTQLLKEYEQILNQTGLNTQQLLQLIEQYEQTLREYQVLLNQVEGLKNKIARRDFPALERDLRRLNEQYNGTQEVQVNKSVTNRYGSISNQADLNKLADDALGYTPPDLSQAYTLANDANVKANQRQYFSERNSKTRSDIERIDSERLNLGDQSELATLQLLVEQNQILMEQIDLQNEMRLSEMSYSNQSDQRISNAILRAKERNLKRLKEAKENGITIDEGLIR
ncbi:hypothetical protein ACQ5UA_17770 [Vibrio cholerae]|uniref:hypothetical protein n=1 Tax=Vibrio cholerae TaxID=666 RepID=UPI003D353BD8|nr:hypothetical protein [Vibrio cholerae]EGR0574558.1 hypothetical protein [Vibrio cholerae]